MMGTQFTVSKGQALSACTLISLGVIDAILQRPEEELSEAQLTAIAREEIVSRSKQYEEKALACGFQRLHQDGSPDCTGYTSSQYVLTDTALYFFQKHISRAGGALSKIPLAPGQHGELSGRLPASGSPLGQLHFHHIQQITGHTMPRAQGVTVGEAFDILASRSLAKQGEPVELRPSEAGGVEDTAALALDFVTNRSDLGLDAMVGFAMIPEGLEEQAIAYDVALSTADEATIKRLLDARPRGLSRKGLRDRILDALDVGSGSGLVVTIESHAISVAYRDSWYYSFNSASGVFIKTKVMEDIADYAMNLHAGTQEVRIDSFTRGVTPSLRAAAAGMGAGSGGSAVAAMKAGGGGGSAGAWGFMPPVPPPATVCPPPGYPSSSSSFFPAHAASLPHTPPTAGAGAPSAPPGVAPVALDFPRGASSDHALRVNTYEFKAPGKPVLTLTGASWNMLGKCFSVADNPRGGYNNNPMDLTEDDDSYFARKTMQLAEILGTIDRFHLDFMLLQEADWWINVPLREKYKIAFSEIGWKIQATPGVSHRLLVTLYKTASLQLIQSSARAGCLPAKGKFCGFPLEFTHLPTRRRVRLVNLHLEFETHYHESLPAYQQLCVAEDLPCIMAGDCNRAPNRTGVAAHSERMSNMIGDWHAATCVSFVGGGLSTKNPRKLDEENVIDGAFVSPGQGECVRITEEGGDYFEVNERGEVALVDYTPHHPTHQSLVGRPWQRLSYLRQEILGEICRLAGSPCSRDTEAKLTNAYKQLAAIAELNPRLTCPNTPAEIIALAQGKRGPLGDDDGDERVAFEKGRGPGRGRY